MKKELNTTGIAQLSKEELAEALINFVKKENKLFKAVDDWLYDNHGLNATKIRYNEGVMVADVKMSVTKGKVNDTLVATPKKETKTKKTEGGFARPNVGIFDYLVSYIQDEKKAKKTSLKFSEVYETAKFKFPTLSEHNLAMYLHDKRMWKKNRLPDVKLDKRKDLVKI